MRPIEKNINLRRGKGLYCEFYDFKKETWFVAVHGVGEQCRRHRYLVDLFSHEFNVALFDLTGHGASKGRRAYIDHFSDYRKDLEELLLFLKKEFSMNRFVLLGHSMGALVVADFLSQLSRKLRPEKVLLSAPPIGINSYLGKKLGEHKLLTKLLTAIPVGIPLRGTIDLRKLSHDIQVYENYVTDKLNCVAIHSKLLLSIVNISNDLFSYPIPYDGPIAFTIGSEDIISDVNSFKAYLEKFGKNSEKLIVEGGYHELHNEIEQYRLPYFSFLRDFFLR